MMAFDRAELNRLYGTDTDTLKLQERQLEMIERQGG